MAKDPDGMGLCCIHCRFVFPGEITSGVMAAHFETEHGTTDVKLELVALCPRCEKPMMFERTETLSSGLLRDYFSCNDCHRSRTVHRNPEET